VRDQTAVQRLVAFDLPSGAQLWERTDLDPQALAVADGRILVDNSHVIDAATGADMWSFQPPAATVHGRANHIAVADGM